MKRRRQGIRQGMQRLADDGLGALMTDAAIPLQQVRTVRRCQRKIGALMDELNEAAKQIATIMLRFPPASPSGERLRETVVVINTMLIDGDKVTGGLDDWCLAQQAKEFPHEQPE